MSFEQNGGDDMTFVKVEYKKENITQKNSLITIVTIFIPYSI